MDAFRITRQPTFQTDLAVRPGKLTPDSGDGSKDVPSTSRSAFLLWAEFGPPLVASP